MPELLSYQVEENLELRLVAKRYSEELCKIVLENLEQLQKWLPWATKDYSIEFADSFVETNLNGLANNEFPSFYVFHNNNLVGGIGYNSIDKINRNVEVGYWLIKDAQGKGIITKCCRHLVGFAFDQMNFNRVVIRCAVENKKSQGIPERLGFTKEGILRETLNIHGEFIDVRVYSMLKKEWESI